MIIYQWIFAINIHLFADNSLVRTGVKTSSQDVFTYPSMIRHDNRYWNNTRYLFEYAPNQSHLNPQIHASLECVREAVDTVSLSMPYYLYYYNKDTKIITDIPDMAPNIGVVVFSHNLSYQASLLPSGGDISAVLFLSSLLKKMCPLVLSRTTYREVKSKNMFDYLVFQYQP